MNNNLQIKLLTKTAILPTRGSEFAIGLDLHADLFDVDGNPAVIKVDGKPQTVLKSEDQNTASITILPGSRILIPTGIAIALPSKHYGRIAPRSGLAAKHGINVLAGVIDEDYRGQVFAAVHCTSKEQPFTIDHGMRIAQLILERASIIEPIQVDELSQTIRNTGGFGSTGS